MIVRSTALAAGLVAALAAPAVAGPRLPGPNAGLISQGETRTHRYDNNPTNDHCIALAQPYRVTLSHLPASDRLTLQVGDLAVTTTNGFASVSFVSGVCTAFDILVTGTAVADRAAYVVNIYSGALAAEDSAAIA